MRNLTFRASVVALAFAAVLPASALTLTIDSPNLVVLQATSGSMTYVFNGSYSYDPGENFSIASLDFAFNADASDRVVTTFIADFSERSYSGPLFSATIDPTTAAGFYGFRGSSTDPSTLSLTAEDDDENELGTIAVPFSIQVQAVPEPSAFAALGLGAVAFLRRRRPAIH